MLTREDLKVGHTYRAKRPNGIFLNIVTRVANDRQILHISGNSVQYDGPSIKVGQRRPVVSVEKFLAWAAYDCTEESPEWWQEWPLTGAQLDRCKEARREASC